MQGNFEDEICEIARKLILHIYDISSNENIYDKYNALIIENEQLKKELDGDEYSSDPEKIGLRDQVVILKNRIEELIKESKNN